MTNKPRMMRENEAYGWLPEDEAYGRVSNVWEQPNAEDENIYSDNEQAPERSEEEMEIMSKAQNDPDWWSENSGLRATFDGYEFFVKNNGELIGRYPPGSGRSVYQTKKATDLPDRGPIYMPEFGKIVREYKENIPLIVKYREDFGRKR